jgi:D-alanine-D-alanine ligase
MRVLVMTHQECGSPDFLDGVPRRKAAPLRTEYDVLCALRKLGHPTRVLGAATELGTIRAALGAWKPDVVFNLLEEFRGEGVHVPWVLGYFELLELPFTGAGPSSLLLADNKPLAKQLLRSQGIPTPNFAIFPKGRRAVRPRGLAFPLLVKSAAFHGSVGIAQKSVVHDDAALAKRVRHVHETLGTEAIAEEFVEGRELSVGVLGNRRLETFPVWEMRFETLGPRTRAIATERAKWDAGYQKRRGIRTGRARRLPAAVVSRIHGLCRRAWRVLDLNGYARMDFRLRPDGRLVLLEANPNPDLAHDEDFAGSARAAGVPYERLIDRILRLAVRRHGERR